MIGSVQLRKYIDLRRGGTERDEAATTAGISVGEARLWDEAEERGEVELALWPLDHNQKEKPVAEGSIAADDLRLLIERIERLEEEKKAISDDVKDVYGEAKARGYDTKTMRTIVRLRKMETQDRTEAQALLETYANALGMQLSLI